jgi:hypothetical protein
MSHGHGGPDRPDNDQLREHAGYYCLGCKHTWSTLFALGQHQGSPYMRGTPCGLEASAAELRNVPRANLATGQALSVPIYHQGEARAGGGLQ